MTNTKDDKTLNKDDFQAQYKKLINIDVKELDGSGYNLDANGIERFNNLKADIPLIDAINRFIMLKIAPIGELINGSFEKYDTQIDDLTRQLSEAKLQMETALGEAKNLRENDIVQLKADLAAAKAAPPSSAVTDKDAEIAELTAKLATAEAVASPIQAKIDPILQAFKTSTTTSVDYDNKYTITKLELNGFQIKLKTDSSTSGS